MHTLHCKQRSTAQCIDTKPRILQSASSLSSANRNHKHRSWAYGRYRVALLLFAPVVINLILQNESCSAFLLQKKRKRCYLHLYSMPLKMRSTTSSLQQKASTSREKPKFSSLQDYMLARNVTIRPIPWCAENGNYCDGVGADSLLQIYQGASVPPIENDALTEAKLRVETLFSLLSVDPDVLSALKDTTLSDVLSSSTVTQLQQFQNLTSSERTLLTIKINAELRSTRPVHATKHVRILYVDDHICVVNKPSGVLAVPGPRRNPSICEAIYNIIKPTDLDHMDQMVVHRLDMDTSGILIFALSKRALLQLHDDFRQRRVSKYYQALVCGHIHVGSAMSEFEVDVDLERDPYHPPFMRIAQYGDTNDRNRTIHGRKSKFLDAAPKPSLTEMFILSYEYLRNDTVHDLPVTRVQLRPHTGRTHQLRVHTASVLGHPIVGDDIYGYGGECSRYGDSYSSSKNHVDVNTQHQIADLGISLCLHAHRLCLRHPISGSPMIFECQPSF
jgi:tRNA pseudouridine32 synthase / 23S rRNA pseudouridine746 synthase